MSTSNLAIGGGGGSIDIKFSHVKSFLAAWVVLSGCCGLVWSQVVTDGSLVRPGGSGASPTTLLGPDIQIPASLGRLECNADRSSCNLYHSFREFNINNGQTATFIGPEGVTGVAPEAVKNILVRVTGGSASNIDGLLRVSGVSGAIGMPNADFYLMNPNGLVFGPRAQLDVEGSFVVTTANEIRLGEGVNTGQWIVSVDPAQSVLSVGHPSAFGFLLSQDSLSADPQQPSSVEMNESVLEVHTREAITVVSGGIELAGAELTAPSGRVNLTSVGSSGRLAYDPQQNIVSLDAEAFDQLGPIDITQEATLDVSGHNPIDRTVGNQPVLASGTIAIQGQDLTVDQGIFLAKHHSDENPTANGVEITLQGDMVLDGSADSFSPGAQMEVSASGKGQGGDIRIQAATLEVLHGSFIAAFTSGFGDPGDLMVEADRVYIDGGGDDTISGLFNTNAFGIGLGSNSGDIIIDTNILEVRNGGQIVTNAFGASDAGDIVVPGASFVVVDGQNVSDLTVIRTLSFFGQGGKVILNTDRLEVLNGGGIASSSVLGRGGDLNITAEDILLSGHNGLDAANLSAGTIRDDDAGTRLGGRGQHHNRYGYLDNSRWRGNDGGGPGLGQQRQYDYPRTG